MIPFIYKSLQCLWPVVLKLLGLLAARFSNELIFFWQIQLLKRVLASKALPFSVCLFERSFKSNVFAVKVARNREGALLLIYHSQLKVEGVAFEQLQAQAKRNGFRLIADRRFRQLPVANNRRRIFCLTPVFIFGMTCLPFKIAADELLTLSMSSVTNASVVRTLNLYSRDNLFLGWPKRFEQSVWQDEESGIDLKTWNYRIEDYERVLAIFNKQWIRSASDPVTLKTDIEQMAEYIAAQPEALALLSSLSSQALYFKYSESDFRTQVKGSHFYVRSATIYFDPRSAAVLHSGADCEINHARCVVSPVDALLHELLHARLALLETKKFIKSGAMNSVIYPYQHEQEVIRQERQTYMRMSKHDDLPRPSRQRHAGHLIKASCVTCLGV